MRLALAIVRGKSLSFDGPGSDLRMRSLLLNMADVFEAYLRNVLRRGLGDRTDLAVADGNHDYPGGKRPLFNSPEAGEATPDIVIRVKDGPRNHETVLLVDAKYKPLKNLPDRDDLNQVVTYAVCYRCPVVVLAHPWKKGSNRGLKSLGRVGDVAVYCHAIDLSSPDLPQTEAAFVKAVRDLIPG